MSASDAVTDAPDSDSVPENDTFISNFEAFMLTM